MPDESGGESSPVAAGGTSRSGGCASSHATGCEGDREKGVIPVSWKGAAVVTIAAVALLPLALGFQAFVAAADPPAGEPELAVGSIELLNQPF